MALYQVFTKKKDELKNVVAKNKKGRFSHMTKICAFGTCVTSDIFNYTFHDRYQVKRFGRNKIATLISDSIDLSEGFFDSLETPNHNKKMIASGFRNDIVQQILSTQSEYLLLDFSDEFLDMIQVDFGGKTFRLMDYWINRGGYWFSQMESLIVGENGIWPNAEAKRIPALETSFDFIENAYKDFVGKILKSETNPNGFEQEKIIVVESYLADHFMNGNGQLQPFPERWAVQSTNQFLKPVYQLFYNLVPNCHRIKLPEFTYGSVNNIWGLHPLHYSADIYMYMSTAIDIITGYHPFRSTLEKLYLEQSLENRLKVRLANAGVIYEISSLKEKMSIMESKNDQLVSDLSEISSRLESANKQIQSLNDERDKLAQKIQENEDTIRQLKTEISKLKSSHSF
ncbi:MAG: hypothetical protein J1E62_10220 [Lachnospiraceae bacterium]|nr:hypothetical protein [Lachnospiraceae bacterium]